MQEYIIKENDAGQRLDKFLHKYLSDAGSSFLYKMLRKKNITLNGKKAEGGEKLEAGDILRFFFSSETMEKFKGNTPIQNYYEAFRQLEPIKVIYENKHILIADKPAGILSQKAEKSDLSLNEWLIGYLLAGHAITSHTLETFKPSVCNRLDRNTSGMVICARTLVGSQEMSRLLKERRIHKYYKLIVKGRLEEEGLLTGSLHKDESTNKVIIDFAEKHSANAADIVTGYKPLKVWHDRTLLEAELITGKTHQIRAHLAGIGHPLLGDYKYGDKAFNDSYKKSFQIEHHLLHAYRLEFEPMTGELGDLNNMVLVCEPPELFRTMEQLGE